MSKTHTDRDFSLLLCLLRSQHHVIRWNGFARLRMRDSDETWGLTWPFISREALDIVATVPDAHQIVAVRLQPVRGINQDAERV